MSTTEPPHQGLGAAQPVSVFRGSQAACFEYALVLEALEIPYERLESDARVFVGNQGSEEAGRVA